MKKFLPLLPAFLLCFAGGASLGTLRDKPATSPAASYLFIPGEKDTSYDSWLKSYKKNEERMTVQLDTQKQLQKEKDAKLTPQDLLGDLNTYKQKAIRDKTFGAWREKALEPPEFKALEKNASDGSKLQENIKKPKLQWDDRIKIYADFMLLEKEHSDLLQKAEKAKTSLIEEFRKLQNP